MAKLEQRLECDYKVEPSLRDPAAGLIYGFGYIAERCPRDEEPP
jgi:hypothetical protein